MINKHNSNIFLFKRSTLALAIALSLNACDGIREDIENKIDGITDEVTDQVTEKVTGKVIDGNIGGATVCFDMTLNFSCKDEPFTALTNPDGTYILTVPAGTDTLAPLIAEIPVGATDSDRGLITKAVTYSSSQTTLSPLTTLVHNETLKNPLLSPEEAEQIVKGQLSINDDTVSLFADYTVEKENNDAYKSLHLKAELINDYLGDISEQIGSLDTENSLSAIESLQLSINQLQSQLAGLMANLEKKLEEPEFDIDSSRFDDFKDDFEKEFENEHSDDGPLKFEDFKSILDDINIAAQVTSTDMRAALKAGIYNFNGDHKDDQEDDSFRFGYELLKLNSSEDQLITTEFYFNGIDWAPSVNTDIEICLGSNGWEEVSESSRNQNISFNDDSTLSLTNIDNTCPGEIVKVGEVSLDGKSLASIFGGPLSELDVSFTTGSKAYHASVKSMADYYSINRWQQQNDSCWVSGSQAQEPVTSALLNNNCNVVASAAGDGSAAKTFNEVFFNSESVLNNTQFSTHLHSSEKEEVVARIFGESNATTGIVKILTRPFEQSGLTPNEWVLIATANWEIKTVNGQEIMSFSNIPSILMNMEEGMPILSVQNGFVRMGEVELADGAFNKGGDSLVLNQIAFEQLKAKSTVFAESQNSDNN